MTVSRGGRHLAGRGRRGHGAAEHQRALEPAAQPRLRSDRGRGQRPDVLAVDRHLAPQRGLGQRLAVDERDDAIAEGEPDVARLKAGGALERDLGAAADESHVSVGQPVLRGRLALCRGRDTRRCRRPPRRGRPPPGWPPPPRRSSAPAGAAAAGRLRGGAEGGDVEATIGALDERDDRLAQEDVTELDTSRQQGQQPQPDAADVELEERLGAELRVLGDLQVVQLDGRQRQHPDRDGAEPHGTPQRLGGAAGDVALDARGVDEPRQGRGRDDHQDDEHRDDAEQPLHPARHGASASPLSPSGSPSASRRSGRRVA